MSTTPARSLTRARLACAALALVALVGVSACSSSSKGSSSSSSSSKAAASSAASSGATSSGSTSSGATGTTIAAQTGACAGPFATPLAPVPDAGTSAAQGTGCDSGTVTAPGGGPFTVPAELAILRSYTCTGTAGADGNGPTLVITPVRADGTALAPDQEFGLSSNGQVALRDATGAQQGFTLKVSVANPSANHCLWHIVVPESAANAAGGPDLSFSS